MLERQQPYRIPERLKEGVARVRRERAEFLRGLTKSAKGGPFKRRPRK